MKSLIISSNFYYRVLKNIQKDLITTRDYLYVMAISIFGIILYILEFPIIKMVYTKIKVPFLMYCVGMLFTQLPFYVLVIISFFQIKYVVPLYVISFIYIFLI